MKIAALILSARFWLSVMFAMTMGMSASAVDIHPVDTAEMACETSHTAKEMLGELEQDGDEQHSEHDHHAHNCGSCHVHMVGMKAEKFSFIGPNATSFRAGADQSHAREGPNGLYRPPRA